jgi:hypothetical protein
VVELGLGFSLPLLFFQKWGWWGGDEAEWGQNSGLFWTLLVGVDPCVWTRVYAEEIQMVVYAEEVRACTRRRYGRVRNLAVIHVPPQLTGPAGFGAAISIPKSKVKSRSCPSPRINLGRPCVPLNITVRPWGSMEALAMFLFRPSLLIHVPEFLS